MVSFMFHCVQNKRDISRKIFSALLMILLATACTPLPAWANDSVQPKPPAQLETVADENNPTQTDSLTQIKESVSDENSVLSEVVSGQEQEREKVILSPEEGSVVQSQDAASIAQSEKLALQGILDQKCIITDFSTGLASDLSAVQGDIQVSSLDLPILPNNKLVPDKLGAEMGFAGIYELVVVSQDSGLIEIDGLRGALHQPLADETSRAADVVVTLRTRDTHEVMASKSFTIQVLPLKENKNNGELSLNLDEKKANESPLVEGSFSANSGLLSSEKQAALQSSAAFTISCKVVGRSASGDEQTWITKMERPASTGMNAAMVTKAALDVGKYTYSSDLATITSPSGYSLTRDAKTGAYWQFSVDGVLSKALASDTLLKPNDEIVWYYSAGTTLPKSDIVVVPDAARPSYVGQWPGYGSAVRPLQDIPTPTESTDLAWAYKCKEPTEWAINVSDLLVVNKDIYVAVGKELRIVDSVTGKVKKTAPLAGAIKTTCRMVYADGVVVVPLEKGRLQALAADNLVSVWLTDALPDDPTGGEQQPLTTLTVHDGYVYFGTAAADWKTSYAGYYMCVSLTTGAIKWSQSNASTGYYWAGAVACGNILIVANDEGVVVSRDAATGAALSTLGLGGSVRSGVIANEAGTEVYVVERAGILHKVAVAQDGTLTKVASVSFSSYSTTTPSLSQGKIYVGGSSVDRKGVFAVIDTSSMTILESISTLSDGSSLPAQILSAPLISVKKGVTYAYFTCNAKPGGVYQYSSATNNCVMLFAPEGDQQNYCMASVVAGADGSLYYTNDSGHFFALKPGEKEIVVPDKPTPDKPTPEKPNPDKPTPEKPTPGNPTPEKPTPEAGGGSGAGEGADSGAGNGVDKKNEDLTIFAPRPASFVTPSKTPISVVEKKITTQSPVADSPTTEKTTARTASSEKEFATNKSESTRVGADETMSSVSPLPIVGVIVGGAGFIGVAVYALRMRRAHKAMIGGSFHE